MKWLTGRVANRKWFLDSAMIFVCLSACLSACAFTRLEGICSHLVSPAVDSRWLMASRWFISHVHRAAAGRSFFVLVFWEAGCCFSFCSLRLAPLPASLPSLLLSPCSAPLDQGSWFVAANAALGSTSVPKAPEGAVAMVQQASLWLMLANGLMTC